MSDEERFRSRSGRSDFGVQLIGPAVGRCGEIVGSVARYLAGDDYDFGVERIEVTGTTARAEALGEADATCFVFLHPEQAPEIDSARRLNEGVVHTLDAWLLGFGDSLDTTGLFYEERDDPLPADEADAVGGVIERLIRAKADPAARRYEQIGDRGVADYVRPADHADHLDALCRTVATTCDNFCTERA